MVTVAFLMGQVIVLERLNWVFLLSQKGSNLISLGITMF